MYHFTRNLEFDVFDRGDIGFHFGSEAQAEKRKDMLKAESGRMFRVYLDIRNPVRIDRDIMAWNANGTALKLWSMGILDDSDLTAINEAWKRGDGYDSESAKNCEAF